MATFSITPVTDFPPPDADAFPNFIQFQADGVDLGLADADTVNFTGGLRATRGTGESSSLVTVRGALLSWRDSANDTTLTLADAGNGVAMTATSGEVFVTVPADTGDETVDFLAGEAVLIFAAATARVTVVSESGVELQYRSAALTNSLAGEFSTATLIKRAANTWVLCGDLESV